MTREGSTPSPSANETIIERIFTKTEEMLRKRMQELPVSAEAHKRNKNYYEYPHGGIGRHIRLKI